MLPRFFVPPDAGGTLLARRSPARPPIPGQLTLDDWERTLSEETPSRGDGRVRPCVAAPGSRVRRPVGRAADRRHPVATELLETPGALLTRSHLRELGLEDRKSVGEG